MLDVVRGEMECNVHARRLQRLRKRGTRLLAASSNLPDGPSMCSAYWSKLRTPRQRVRTMQH